MRNVLRSIRRAIREEFAAYAVWDDCGTVQMCFTMREAMEWLPYCGNNAGIINRKTRVIEVSRHQAIA